MNQEQRLEVIKQWHWSALKNGVVTVSIDNCQITECSLCSILVCAHAEMLHLHHDGCPACHMTHELTEDCDECCADTAVSRIHGNVHAYLSPSKRYIVCKTCQDTAHAPRDGFGDDEIALFMRIHAHVSDRRKPIPSFIVALDAEKNR